MTTAQIAVQPSLTIDPLRWPDVARLPRGAYTSAAARVVQPLFLRAVTRAGVSVQFMDGALPPVVGPHDAPLMEIFDTAAFMRRLGRDGLIGLGESYMAGEWDSARLSDLIAVFASAIDDLAPAALHRVRHLHLRRKPKTERPSRRNSRENVRRHYDLSNELFALFLDPSMTYSSALFDRGADTPLQDAQHRKIDRLLDATQTGAGTRLLEIGTGWGELALRAAGRGARVHSVTLSTEQQREARNKLAAAELDGQADVELLDYRHVEGRYDAVASVEMIEAVGLEYLDTYFRKIADVLVPGGRAGIQAITLPHHRAVQTRNTYTWIHKYVFPGGALPSLTMLTQAAERAGLRLTDDLAFGASYARTLAAWAEAFDAASARLPELGFDDVFRRMWTFYLRYCEGGFAAGYLDVHQLTFVKESGRC